MCNARTKLNLHGCWRIGFTPVIGRADDKTWIWFKNDCVGLVLDLYNTEILVIFMNARKQRFGMYWLGFIYSSEHSSCGFLNTCGDNVGIPHTSHTLFVCVIHGARLLCLCDWFAGASWDKFLSTCGKCVETCNLNLIQFFYIKRCASWRIQIATYNNWSLLLPSRFFW